MSKGRIPRVWLTAGIGVAAVALLWLLIAPGQLVKYPKNLSISPQYAGTFTLFVDPQTAAPLAQAQAIPLTVDRKLQGHDATSSKVVMDETITQKAGPLTLVQNNAYVMDRKTLKNVKDDRAYAFSPANVVDRAGLYRLNLPFDTSRSETYGIAKNEIIGSYQLVSDPSAPTGKRAGLKVDNFAASVKDAPVSPAYLAWLRTAVPIPDTVTLASLKPQLKASGVDLDAIIGSLSTVLTPQEMAAIGQAATTPLKVSYAYSFDGNAAVEPTTGAEMFVKVSESLAAKPDVTPLAGLQAILAKYPTSPQVQAAGKALAAVAAVPATTLFKADYEQTPASVADVAKTVKSQRTKMAWVRLWAPLLMGLAAVVLLAVAGFRWARRPAAAEEGTTPTRRRFHLPRLAAHH